jgi:hypothetical protein
MTFNGTVYRHAEWLPKQDQDPRHCSRIPDASKPLLQRLHIDVTKAQDSLLAAKITQAEFVNHHCSDEDTFKVGNKVMLSTEHHHHKYIQAKSGHVAKFMPCSDDPFLITNANPTKSSYTLDLPSDVLGWVSSPEPAGPSPFRPDQSPARARASSGLGPGLRS